MKEKYPCWYSKDAKEIAESLIDYGYCYPERYECEDSVIEAASYYGWKIYHDSTSIEVCYQGASYGMYFEYEEYEDEAEIEIESIVKETRSLIGNVMKKNQQKYDQLSLF